MTSRDSGWEPNTVNEKAKPEIRLLILGAGNLLHKDEGVGVHVAQRLGDTPLPRDVQVIDCGTSLLDVVSFIEKAERLILVDAIRTGAQPGTIFKLRDKDISEHPRKLVSLHQLGLLEALEMVDKLGKRPPTTIIGVEPKDVGMGMELSSTVQSVIPKVLDLVLEEVSSSKVSNMNC